MSGPGRRCAPAARARRRLRNICQLFQKDGTLGRTMTATVGLVDRRSMLSTNTHSRRGTNLGFVGKRGVPGFGAGWRRAWQAGAIGQHVGAEDDDDSHAASQRHVVVPDNLGLMDSNATIAAPTPGGSTQAVSLSVASRESTLRCQASRSIAKRSTARHRTAWCATQHTAWHRWRQLQKV